MILGRRVGLQELEACHLLLAAEVALRYGLNPKIEIF